jgi:hypothetical protein
MAVFTEGDQFLVMLGEDGITRSLQWKVAEDK